MRRRVVNAFIDVIVLTQLGNRSSLSGYDIIAFVHRKYNVLVSSGKVYSVLYRLERAGFVRGSFSHRRRVYELTEQGEERIRTIQNRVEEIQKLLQSILTGR